MSKYEAPSCCEEQWVDVLTLPVKFFQMRHGPILTEVGPLIVFFIDQTKRMDRCEGYMYKMPLNILGRVIVNDRERSAHLSQRLSSSENEAWPESVPSPIPSTSPDPQSYAPQYASTVILRPRFPLLCVIIAIKGAGNSRLSGIRAKKRKIQDDVTNSGRDVREFDKQV